MKIKINKQNPIRPKMPKQNQKLPQYTYIKQDQTVEFIVLATATGHGPATE